MSTGTGTLIKNAQLSAQGRVADLRIESGIIASIDAGLAAGPGDTVIEAGGGLLLPGLHDHHIHLVALAASLDSLRCGPPDIQSAEQLASVLSEQNPAPNSGWVRGIAYHPCIAGDIDKYWLDRYVPDRPVRIQHRGGRLWVLNSRALQELGLPGNDNPTGLELVDGQLSGRLFEGDHWLRGRLNSQFPNLAKASNILARYGVTGITDTTPTNGTAEWAHFKQSQLNGQLQQRARMMGSEQILDCAETALLQRGELKIHLLESRLPELDTLHRDIASAHANGRSVAVHCVTLTELVFALSALKTAGVQSGDRIEHASVTPPDMLQSIRALKLRVVIQPHFIAERGDQYLADVDTEDQPWLYRAASFLAAGISLVGGSDAPFGSADPWSAMRAAVQRRTPSGRIMDAAEALTPEQALSLFLYEPGAPGLEAKKLSIGAPADLCLLDSPWDVVRGDLSSRYVRSTWQAGKLVYRSA